MIRTALALLIAAFLTVSVAACGSSSASTQRAQTEPREIELTPAQINHAEETNGWTGEYVVAAREDLEKDGMPSARCSAVYLATHVPISHYLHESPTEEKEQASSMVAFCES